ncbi:MAG: hypothetical protein ACR650_17695 [Methylocystis sp.]|jgi:hypothetical protein
MRIHALAVLASLALAASPPFAIAKQHKSYGYSHAYGAGKFSPKNLSRSQIMKIQAGLDKAGFNAGPADGKWGAKTQKAGMAFMKSRNRTAVSQLTNKDLAKLGLNWSMFGGRPGSASAYGSAPRR